MFFNSSYIQSWATSPTEGEVVSRSFTENTSNGNIK